MAKKYKKGNRKKKKERANTDFYKREQEINKLVNKFVINYYNLQKPPQHTEYEQMNKQRLEIKRLLTLQDSDLWKQSRRRKRFYHKQLNKFKYYYTAWKHFTYYIYLEEKYGIPVRFATTLSYFMKVNHDIVSIRYQL